MKRVRTSGVLSSLGIAFAAFAAMATQTEQPALADQNSSSPWTIQGTSAWARWAPAPFKRWDKYNDIDSRVQLVAEPGNKSAVYFLKADGSVGYRNVDANVNKTFPGLKAKQIAVGAKGRLWAITTDGRWARWAPAPYNRWDMYNDLNGKVQLVGDPTSEGGIYFRLTDGSIGFRNVDANVNVSFPGITATEFTVSDVAK